jgi:hypothetical protein
MIPTRQTFPNKENNVTRANHEIHRERKTNTERKGKDCRGVDRWPDRYIDRQVSR